MRYFTLLSGKSDTTTSQKYLPWNHTDMYWYLQWENINFNNILRPIFVILCVTTEKLLIEIQSKKGNLCVGVVGFFGLVFF